MSINSPIVPVDEALVALGDLLERRGQTAAIVIVGGAAFKLLGLVARTTRDVDVIARADGDVSKEPTTIFAPDPIPDDLARAIETVARDLGLQSDWLNTAVASQWQTGVPPGLEQDITWRREGGLWIGLPGRFPLICLKLYAAADDIGPTSRHFTDLLTLRPTRSELTLADEWIGTQDGSPDFANVVKEVIRHVLERTG